jgi:hypothetical protein
MEYMMAYYLVQAKPIDHLLVELRQHLDSGEIKVMKPFGQALQYGLDHARLQSNGTAIWEEEDYCVPPLAQERAAILDTYFKELNVEPVEKTEGWKKIESIPMLWQK